MSLLGMESQLIINGETVIDDSEQWQAIAVNCSSLSDTNGEGLKNIGKPYSDTLLSFSLDLFGIVTATLSLKGGVHIKAAVSQCVASSRPMLGVAGAIIGASGL